MIISSYVTGLCIYGAVLFIVIVECTLSTYIERKVGCGTLRCVTLAQTLRVYQVS